MWSDISSYFWFSLPWWLVMLHTFSCTCWPFKVFFVKMFVQYLCPFLSWITWGFCYCVLYIFWILTPFNHSIGFLFILFIVSFAVQKLFTLMWSHLLLFVFAFQDIYKKLLSRPSSRSFSSCFLLRLLWSQAFCLRQFILS